MILEQFLNKKAEEIDNPIRNWGVGFTAEVINEWINLQIQVKKLAIPDVSGSLPSLDDATKVAVRISEEAIKPPFDAKEQAIFIAGFQECIKWLNVVFSNDL